MSLFVVIRANLNLSLPSTKAQTKNRNPRRTTWFEICLLQTNRRENRRFR
jgi:hypothetical protein